MKMTDSSLLLAGHYFGFRTNLILNYIGWVRWSYIKDQFISVRSGGLDNHAMKTFLINRGSDWSCDILKSDYLDG